MDFRAHCSANCSLPVAINVSLNTNIVVIATVIMCAETAARYSHITRHLIFSFLCEEKTLR